MKSPIDDGEAVRAIMHACAVAMLWAGAALAGYGDKVDSLPDWRERACIVLTNACRMAPVAYRDTYLDAEGILLPHNYPPVNPVYHHHDLALAARRHSIDMAHDCLMQHNSCDGTHWAERVQSHYTVSRTIAENISYNTPTPQGVVRGWLLDSWSSSNPAPDKSDNDGHRQNIMNAAYRDIGCGFVAAGATFWTQDFGGGSSATYPRAKVAGASHLFLHDRKTTFMLNYFDVDATAPTTVSLILEGTSHAMTPHMGSAHRGTYAIELERGGTCRTYHFEVVDGDGRRHRYPAEGELVTTGEGGCEQDYVAVSVATPPAQPASPPLAPRIAVADGFLYITIRKASTIALVIADPAGRIMKATNRRRIAAGRHALPLEPATLAPAVLSVMYEVDGRNDSRTILTHSVLRGY